MLIFKRKLYDAIAVSVTICSIITLTNWIQNPDFKIMGFIFSRPMLAGSIMGFFLYLGNSYCFVWIRKIFPYENQYKKRILLFFPTIIITTLVIVFCVNLLIFSIGSKITIINLIKAQQINYYLKISILSTCISLLIYSFNFYKLFKESQIEKQIQIANEANAKLKSLKNQIDPHFLFNSLNVLTGLIEEDQKKAIGYTHSLSRIYRYILEQKDAPTTSILQEIEFAQNYINLLKLRFEDAISYKIDTDVMQLKGQVIPLALQLLLENCIQHNIATEKNKLHIHISTDQKNLIISNNLQEKKNKMMSTKIGLNNITERYKLLTKEQVQIINNNNIYTVKLPIINSYD